MDAKAKEERRRKLLTHYKDLARADGRGWDNAIFSAVDDMMHTEQMRDDLQAYKSDAITLFQVIKHPKEECDCEPEVGNVPCMDCAVRSMANGETWSRG